MKKLAIEVENAVVQRIGNPTMALNGICIRVEAGSFVAICGHNGAGKTTFARVLAGIVPLASGGVKIYEKSLGDSPSERVMMVFQPPMAQVLGATILEEIGMTLADAEHISTADLRRRVIDICQQFGIDAPLDTPVARLSGGQIARLCIAQAIASGADILVMDEALQELDPAARLAISSLLRQLADGGKTILSITHDMEDVRFADRVIVFDHGSIAGDWPASSFFYGESLDDSMARANKAELSAATPCERLGFEAPYLVRVARSFNPIWARSTAPLSEEELTEALAHATFS